MRLLVGRHGAHEQEVLWQGLDPSEFARRCAASARVWPSWADVGRFRAHGERTRDIRWVQQQATWLQQARPLGKPTRRRIAFKAILLADRYFALARCSPTQRAAPDRILIECLRLACKFEGVEGREAILPGNLNIEAEVLHTVGFSLVASGPDVLLSEWLLPVCRVVAAKLFGHERHAAWRREQLRWLRRSESMLLDVLRYAHVTYAYPPVILALATLSCAMMCQPVFGNEDEHWGKVLVMCRILMIHTQEAGPAAGSEVPLLECQKWVFQCCLDESFESGDEPAQAHFAAGLRALRRLHAGGA